MNEEMYDDLKHRMRYYSIHRIAIRLAFGGPRRRFAWWYGLWALYAVVLPMTVYKQTTGQKDVAVGPQLIPATGLELVIAVFSGLGGLALYTVVRRWAQERKQVRELVGAIRAIANEEPPNDGYKR